MFIDRNWTVLYGASGKNIVARHVILPKATFESISQWRGRQTALTRSNSACYRFAAPDTNGRRTRLVSPMPWTDMTRRVTNWVVLLSTYGVLSVICECPAPWEGRAFAGAASAEIHAPVQELPGAVSPPEKTLERQAPEKAYALLEALKQRNGEPLPGYVGGKTFQNRERRLPSGRYKEYDVNRRVRGRPRDAERLVIEQDTGKAYYTADHYRTFAPLN
jgi:ribonuclease T1